MKCEINGQTAEKLFYNNWMYNVVRIQNKLKKIFEDNGGEMVHADRYVTEPAIKKTPTYVVNRSLMERIIELEKHLVNFDHVAPEYRNRYVEYDHERERLLQLPNEPLPKTDASDFVQSGVFYSIKFDTNMFFDTLYAVARVEPTGKNQVVRFKYYRKFTDDWKYDCLFHCDCSQADIDEISYQIYNTLLQTTPFQNSGDPFYIHKT